MRLHRPRVTMDVLASSLGDAERQLAFLEYDHPLRLFAARFQPHQTGDGYVGELQAFLLTPEPAGAAWVESDLWHPAAELELAVVTAGVDDVRAAVEAFVDNREFWIGAVTLAEFNTNNPEYRGKVTVRLGNVKEVTAMRGPRGGIGV